MSWRRSGRLSNSTWRGPPRVHQKAKPETSSSYRRPPIMTSSDLRSRISAHGTGRPTVIGAWQIGPAPDGHESAHHTAYGAGGADERLTHSQPDAWPHRLPWGLEVLGLGGVVLFHAGHPSFTSWSNGTGTGELNQH